MMNHSSGSSSAFLFINLFYFAVDRWWQRAYTLDDRLPFGKPNIRVCSVYNLFSVVGVSLMRSHSLHTQFRIYIFIRIRQDNSSNYDFLVDPCAPVYRFLFLVLIFVFENVGLALSGAMQFVGRMIQRTATEFHAPQCLMRTQKCFRYLFLYLSQMEIFLHFAQYGGWSTFAICSKFDLNVVCSYVYCCLEILFLSSLKLSFAHMRNNTITNCKYSSFDCSDFVRVGEKKFAEKKNLGGLNCLTNILSLLITTSAKTSPHLIDVLEKKKVSYNFAVTFQICVDVRHRLQLSLWNSGHENLLNIRFR